MKVLIVAPYFFERHRWMISAYKTAHHLSRLMEVVVLTTGTPPYEELNPRLRIYRLRDWFIPDPVNYSVVPGLLPGLRRVIRKERPDIFLVNKHMFFTSFAVPLLRLMGKRVILATDTFPGINWMPRHPLVRIVMIVYAYLIGWPILKSANQVILYHDGLLPVAKRLGIRAQVIHNGVDLEAIDQARAPSDLVKTPGEIWIGYVGRLESIKGYDDLLAVAKSLVPSYPNVRWLFVGSFHGKEEFVKRETLPEIQFIGHRDDVHGIMKLLDIFVLPSYSEGLPNALMEAMAAGLACVASRVGGVQQLIEEQVNGITFEPGQRGQLREVLERLIQNTADRQRLAARAREKIVRAYNWDTLASEYQNMFSDMMAKP